MDQDRDLFEKIGLPRQRDVRSMLTLWPITSKAATARLEAASPASVSASVVALHIDGDVDEKAFWAAALNRDIV